MMPRLLVAGLAFTLSPLASADGPADNVPQVVRRIPKPGIEVPNEVRRELERELDSLSARIDQLLTRGDSRTAALLPDIQIFHKAANDALKYHEFFDAKEFEKARVLLKEGTARADALIEGKAPWTTQRGLVVRGYVSKIDGSVQPFGLVIPDSYMFEGPLRYRTDIWFHGRGETLSELNFTSERMTQPGTFTPNDTIVLHPYGRYCNAFKFAGEVDVYEALDAVKRGYKVDEDRVSVRGFSMGGAAAWHFAVHNPTAWFAANPGAGFSETPRFLDVFQNEKLAPSWYEKTLWNLYDCDKWAGNIRMVPTVAYSGEIDKQKQAADVMAEALAPFGIKLVHIIGKGAGHNYTPEARSAVEERIKAIEKSGRNPSSRVACLTTYSLHYNKAAFATIDSIEEHWKPATLAVEVDQYFDVYALTNGAVRAFSISLPAGTDQRNGQLDTLINPRQIQMRVDRDFVKGRALLSSDGSFQFAFHKEGNTWKLGPLPSDGLRKQHGLQGPIDDAFMDSFVFVKPTGQSPNPKFASWCDQEMNRAIEHWRRHFRGEPRVKSDDAITDEDIAAHNLVLWGDPASNAILKKIAAKLPINWNNEHITAGSQRYPSTDHGLILIYPNPLNPMRYVVLNSSFTFRDYDYLNNARQTPKLPDWAVIDLKTPPDSRWPGKVVAADFFGETWELKAPRDRP